MGTRKHDQSGRKERWLARMTPALVTTIRACFAVQGTRSYLRVYAIFVAVGKELGHQLADQKNCAQHLCTLIEQLRASYDPMRGDPRTFTYTFARNKGRSFFRLLRERPHHFEIKPTKSKPEQSPPFDDSKTNVFPFAPSKSGDPADPRSPDEALVRHQELELLHTSLAKLSPTKRHIVTLFHLKHVPWAAIAGELKLPISTVQSRGSQGFSELTAIIKNGGTPPPKPPRTRKSRPRKD